MRTAGERRFDPGPCEERDSPYEISDSLAPSGLGFRDDGCEAYRLRNSSRAIRIALPEVDARARDPLDGPAVDGVALLEGYVLARLVSRHEGDGARPRPIARQDAEQGEGVGVDRTLGYGTAHRRGQGARLADEREVSTTRTRSEPRAGASAWLAGGAQDLAPDWLQHTTIPRDPTPAWIARSRRSPAGIAADACRCHDPVRDC